MITMKTSRKFPELEGHTFTRVMTLYGVEMIFSRDDGKIFNFYHSQDCCESVWIESIVGDLAHLIGSPILHATETIVVGDILGDNRLTKAFYWFKTEKGEVTVRWNGRSNGFYSTKVHFGECDESS